MNKTLIIAATALFPCFASANTIEEVARNYVSENETVCEIVSNYKSVLVSKNGMKFWDSIVKAGFFTIESKDGNGALRLELTDLGKKHYRKINGQEKLCFGKAHVVGFKGARQSGLKANAVLEVQVDSIITQAEKVIGRKSVGDRFFFTVSLRNNGNDWEVYEK